MTGFNYNFLLTPFFGKLCNLKQNNYNQNIDNSIFFCFAIPTELIFHGYLNQLRSFQKHLARGPHRFYTNLHTFGGYITEFFRNIFKYEEHL